ncbi:MAG: transposase [Actinoallomurus sp.]
MYKPPGGVAVEPDDHGLGRSRGGLTTKLHLAVEQGQKPMSIVLTAGQRGDFPQFEPVLNKIRVARTGSGRPRTRPNRVRADKAYASRKNRAYLSQRGIRCTIPDKADKALNRKKRGSRGGRPPKFDKIDYRGRLLSLTLRRGTDGPARLSQPSRMFRTGAVDEEVWSTCAGVPSS